MAKAHAMPACTMTTPPTAGPANRARLKTTELSAIALPRLRSRTRLGSSASRAGWLKAAMTPVAAVSRNSSSMVIRPAAVNAASAPACTSLKTLASFRIGRRR